MKKLQLLLVIALGSLTGLGSGGLTPQALAQTSVQAIAPEMKHYKSSEWNFELDVPKSWNRFPPVSTNSPFEVTRFLSNENGAHSLIVFRSPNNPKADPKVVLDKTQEFLAKLGYSNFSQSEAKIGANVIKTLDFDRIANGGAPSHCRQYFFAHGTLMYVLFFGTTDRETMFPLYDRMAKTFVAVD